MRMVLHYLELLLSKKNSMQQYVGAEMYSCFEFATLN